MKTKICTTGFKKIEKGGNVTLISDAGTITLKKTQIAEHIEDCNFLLHNPGK